MPTNEDAMNKSTGKAGSTPTRRTDEEVLRELNSDSPLNKARRLFSHGSAGIEQAHLQRGGLTPIEMRRMEFEATEAILATQPAPGAGDGVREAATPEAAKYVSKVGARGVLADALGFCRVAGTRDMLMEKFDGQQLRVWADGIIELLGRYGLSIARHCPAHGAEGALVEATRVLLECKQRIVSQLNVGIVSADPENEDPSHEFSELLPDIEDALAALKSTNPKPDSGGE